MRKTFVETFEGTKDERSLLNNIFITLYMAIGENEGVNKEQEIMEIESR